MILLLNASLLCDLVGKVLLTTQATGVWFKSNPWKSFYLWLSTSFTYLYVSHHWSQCRVYFGKKIVLSFEKLKDSFGFCCASFLNSVNRFGTILPLWPDLTKFSHIGKFKKSLALFPRSLSKIWPNFELTLAKFVFAFEQICIVVNGQIVINNLAICSHCLWTTFPLHCMRRGPYWAD